MESSRDVRPLVQEFQYAVRTKYSNGRVGYLLEPNKEGAQRYIDEQTRIHDSPGFPGPPLDIVMREVGPWVEVGVLGTSVLELGLLPRTENFLLRAYPTPVTTLGQLVGPDRVELLDCRGYGPATAKDIDDMLERYGLPYYTSPWHEQHNSPS